MERSPTVSPICAAQAVIGAGVLLERDERAAAVEFGMDAGDFGQNRTARCGECQYGFLCGESA